MAFKATRKPSTKKTATTKAESKVLPTDESVATSVPSEILSKETSDFSHSEVVTDQEPKITISIEDLVGAPKTELNNDAPAQTAPASPVATAHMSPPVYQPSQGASRYQPRDMGRSGYNNGGHRYAGNNRRDNGYTRDDRYRRSGGGEYYRRDTGYRRDTYASNGPRDLGAGYVKREPYADASSSYGPDINVPTETVRGVLDTLPEGHGFLRPKYTPSERDIYISQSQIRRFLLRNGDMVEGQARPPKESERYYGLLKVEKVNELPAELMEKRPKFEDLVPIYPNRLLRLETEKTILSSRIIDLLAPIGFGQRGLIVSPPKAGKTTVLKELAAGISQNYPEVHLMAVLIGERPEEVTDISRNVHGEVYASNFDESPEHQTRVAEVALDRAKRLIEMGHDVVILLDSITRLARAYNLVVNPSGRTLTGGFDPAALYPAKKFLGAARCNEPFVTPEEEAKKVVADAGSPKRVTDGGSLTIIGTALVETGSRMDDLIYEEFKGTGNMELHLSRTLQERRIFPAIDVGKSGTRHDELLLGEDAMKKVVTLRHMLSLLSDEERTMMLIDRLSKTKSNAEFLESLGKD
jgi:transcription termination factor Rho